jgi:hypothetical protein
MVLNECVRADYHICADSCRRADDCSRVNVHKRGNASMAVAVRLVAG